MRQIINVQLGQCGNQVSHNFWKTIAEQHGINDKGKYEGDSDLQLLRTNVYFNENSKRKYTARSILVDLEPGPIDSARASSICQLFNPDNFVVGIGGGGSNWAKGYYGQGATLIEQLMDAVRREAQNCDYLQGFQLTHSLGGGTGSGMGSLMLNRIKDEFNDRMKLSFSVLPSNKVSDTVIEPYNTILSIQQMMENISGCIVLQNEALYGICSRKMKKEHPVYADLNKIVAQIMSGVTCSFRFPGQINSDIRKMMVNLVPFPRLKYFMASHAPITATGDDSEKNHNVIELVQEIFNFYNSMPDINIGKGKYLTASTIFRGKLSTKEVEKTLISIKEKTQYFVDYLPDNFEVSMCDIPPKGFQSGATMLANQTSIRDVFKRMNQKFNSLWKRRAFIHWYTNQGMEQMDLIQAYSDVNELISEYELYTNMQADEEQDIFD